MKYRRQCDQKACEAASLASAQANDQPSKTLQGPALEADINFIAKTYGLTPANYMPPEVYDPRYYGDMTDIPDLQTALDRIRDANEHFMQLPANLRRRFNDSPGYLWEFLQDPNNLKEAVQLGILKEMPPEASQASTEAVQTPPT